MRNLFALISPLDVPTSLMPLATWTQAGFVVHRVPELPWALSLVSPEDCQARTVVCAHFCARRHHGALLFEFPEPLDQRLSAEHLAYQVFEAWLTKLDQAFSPWIRQHQADSARVLCLVMLDPFDQQGCLWKTWTLNISELTYPLNVRRKKSSLYVRTRSLAFWIDLRTGCLWLRAQACGEQAKDSPVIINQTCLSFKRSGLG